MQERTEIPDPARARSSSAHSLEWVGVLLIEIFLRFLHELGKTIIKCSLGIFTHQDLNKTGPSNPWVGNHFSLFRK